MPPRNSSKLFQSDEYSSDFLIAICSPYVRVVTMHVAPSYGP